jgi:hypothetical protein
MQAKSFVIIIFVLKAILLPAQVIVSVYFEDKSMPMPSLSFPVNAIENIENYSSENPKKCDCCTSCPSDFTCKLGFCVSSRMPFQSSSISPCISNQCPNGFQCISNQCYPLTPAVNPFTKTTVKIYFKNNSMPIPSITVPANSIMRVEYSSSGLLQECASCKSCPVGYTCKFGFCELLENYTSISIGPCVSNLCPSGFTCINDECIQVVPKSDNQNSNGKCTNGQCPVGFECVNDKCLPKFPKN